MGSATAQRAGSAAALLVATGVLLSGCSGNPSGDPSAGDPSPGASTPGQASTPADPASSPAASSSPSPSPEPQVQELPRGGTKIFPDYRLMGYSGAPDAPGQGRLGIGDLNTRVVEMEKRGQPYAKGRKVMPVMELIATTVHASPGKDNKYRTRIDDKVIEQWLKVARKNKAMLLLNIQPGRSSFIEEVRAYQKWLEQPDVGLALDPEWAVSPGQVPGRVFGHTTGKDLNEVAEWTSKLVAEKNLPEKALVYHQLNPGVVRKENDLKRHDGVVLIKSIDGIGSPGAKTATWNRIVKTLPKHVHPGFKLFYQEDAEGSSRVMKPAEVMALKPRPEYVLYE